MAKTQTQIDAEIYRRLCEIDAAYPCGRCGSKDRATCGKRSCERWRLWFCGAWRKIRKSLGKDEL